MTDPPRLAEYVGLPFVEHGRSRAGIDCWGCIQLIYREQFGIELPSYSERYVSTADQHAIAQVIRGELGPWREVERGAEVSGDVVLLLIPDRCGLWPAHVGLVIEPGRMLHCERDTGTAQGWYDGPRGVRWNRRVAGIYRHEERC